MEDLTVMIVGSGAREHAISDAFEKSPQIKKLIVAPGNDFIAYKRQKEVIVNDDCKACDLKKPETFVELARKYEPDLIDVAQDDALAMGTVDLLQENGFDVFGPSQAAARIEWDKVWSREFMLKYGLPTPGFRPFTKEFPAKTFARTIYDNEPDKLIYVKAGGLCAGKGALKAKSLDQAIANIDKMVEFGEAGKSFVIEDGLVGEEFSCYIVSDGKNYHIFKSAQDNKRALNFDQGEQTGGMGVISPAMVTEDLWDQIDDELIVNVIKGMIKEGTPYTGILYVGGIKTEQGLKIIEYNARWGDPECQVILPSVQTDYVDIASGCIDGDLDKLTITEDDKVRVCVIGASKGYPGDYSEVKGKQIFGLGEAMALDGVKVFGAGISVEDDKLYAQGGRLFSIVGEGADILEARQRAYAAMGCVHIEGNNLHYRTDIGWRDVERYINSK